MTFTELFSSRPSKKNTFLLLIFSIITFLVSYVVMNFFHALAIDPVQNIFETQLSFSGAYMKWQYANMGSIEYYRLVAITDYAFMAAYGLLLFILSLIVARRFSEDHLMRKLVIFTAIFGLIAACLDAIENGFILAMLTDPSGFPDIWAIAHSTFALIKWTLGAISLFNIILGFLLSLIIND